MQGTLYSSLIVRGYSYHGYMEYKFTLSEGLF
jgi:hypothetical protein